MELIEETTRALQEGYEQIVAVGGDGTVNAAANGFFDPQGNPFRPEACLAVAPLGSGSDFFKTLQGKSKSNWREIVLDPKLIQADVGVFEKEQERTCFLNMASVGTSAEIVRKKESLPGWVPRKLCYVIPTLQQVTRLRPFSAEVILDGNAIHSRLINLFIAKGMYAGGGMRFGGSVALDDGLFEITLVEAIKATVALRSLHRLFTGSLDQVEGVRKVQASHVKILTDDSVPIEIDGENCGVLPAEFRLMRRSLKICGA